MKVKISGIEIDSDKVVSNITIHINYISESNEQVTVINANPKQEEETKFLRGSIFEQDQEY